jgi:large subunit ribosomal protein L7/L12
MAKTIETLVQDIKGLTLLEVAELVSALEKEFGVSAAAMAVGAAQGGAAEAAKPAEEKSEYKVKLVDGGPDKIKTIKALREVKKDLGLAEAKKTVESAPVMISEAASKEEAQALKEKLEAAGAKVELS